MELNLLSMKQTMKHNSTKLYVEVQAKKVIKRTYLKESDSL